MELTSTTEDASLLGYNGVTFTQFTQWHSITSHKTYIFNSTAVRISNVTVLSAVLVKHFIWTMCLRLIHRKISITALQAIRCFVSSGMLFSIKQQFVTDILQPWWWEWHAVLKTSLTNYRTAQDPRKFKTSASPRQNPKISHQTGIPIWLDSCSMLSGSSVSIISDLSNTSVTVHSVMVWVICDTVIFNFHLR
jgi:hypothetical protein